MFSFSFLYLFYIFFFPLSLSFAPEHCSIYIICHVVSMNCRSYSLATEFSMYKLHYEIFLLCVLLEHSIQRLTILENIANYRIVLQIPLSRFHFGWFSHSFVCFAFFRLCDKIDTFIAWTKLLNQFDAMNCLLFCCPLIWPCRCTHTHTNHIRKFKRHSGHSNHYEVATMHLNIA